MKKFMFFAAMCFIGTLVACSTQEDTSSKLTETQATAPVRITETLEMNNFRVALTALHQQQGLARRNGESSELFKKRQPDRYIGAIQKSATFFGLYS